MFRLLSLAHGKVAALTPWRVCHHITCFGQWNVSGDVSFPGGIFTASLYFDTPSFPSISATNLYLLFYLCFCLSSCLSLISTFFTVSLLVTYVHTSHVFLSHTFASFFIAHWSIYIWPSTPASSKWQLDPKSTWSYFHKKESDCPSLR